MTMNTENNIIAIRKRDIVNAHKAFAELMGTTEDILNREANEYPRKYKQLTPSSLEACAVEKIKMACRRSSSPFNENEVKLVSGHKFPDIIAEKFYGIEVKSTKENHWTSTGSSIVETTRVKNVDDIYMLFGKLGGEIPEFRCRPYQDVLYDIAVTHSPRYLINMELQVKDTIFSKMGTTYDDFRTSKDTISLARQYYRDQAKKKKNQEMPWWLTEDNVESAHSFTVKLWNSLDKTEKRELQTKCMILFPEALDPARKPTTYNNTTLWLCANSQVVNPNIRDLYSAGGKITHVNGYKLKHPVAQVFNIIVDYSDEIKELLSHPSPELLLMIKEYNPALLNKNDRFEAWLDICDKFAKKHEVPLRQWIETKPTFLFSKK